MVKRVYVSVLAEGMPLKGVLAVGVSVLAERYLKAKLLLYTFNGACACRVMSCWCSLKGLYNYNIRFGVVVDRYFILSVGGKLWVNWL